MLVNSDTRSGILVAKRRLLTYFVVYRLGIEVAKTLSIPYSNRETSITIGESVRDEDGKLPPNPPPAPPAPRLPGPIRSCPRREI